MDIYPTTESEAPTRAPWKLALRIALSVLMLVVLAWRVPDVRWEDLVPDWDPTTPLWLVATVLTMFAAFALSTLRWERVVRPLADPPPLRRMFSHLIAGQFVSNVLPTSFGGDFIRVSRLGRDIGSTPKAFASVTIDRLTGWLVLPAISTIAMASQPRLLQLGSATATALAIDAVTVTALIIILLTAANRRFAADLDDVVGWRRFLLAVHLGVDGLRRMPSAAGRVLAVGVAFQLVDCLAVWLTARAIGVDSVTLGVTLAFYPAAAIAQNLPIGIGGLGVREGAFLLFFGAVGAPRGQAIALGLTVYLLTVLTSSIGAPSFAMGHRTTADPTPGYGTQGPPGA